jgi:HK97 family phage major capsid protein
MYNKDEVNEKVTEIFQAFGDAVRNDDAEGAAKAFQEAQEQLCEMIEQQFNQYGNIADIAVLQQRGLRALTSEENDWYQKFIGAVRTDAKQAITGLTAAMPVTIIDRVIEDMKKNHPLLDAITIQNAAGAQKLVMNGVQMASKLGGWGQITSAISTELAGQIKVVDVTVAKYTAYFIIPKDYVKFNFAFAPMWVDQYIRIILSESIAFGLEKTIVSGDGNNQFIGMDRDITSVSNNAYTAKSAVAIANWGDDYAGVIAGMAKDDNNDDRNVPEALLVVNPQDNIKKIRKAQNVITHAGILDMISHTWPTKVVTSSMIAEGKAIVGIAANYFAAINGGTSGIIEYDDSNQFLQDNRIYTTRVYGNGQPVDNKSFALLDISNVADPALPVEVKGTVSTKETA